MVASGVNARIAYVGETTRGTTPASPAFTVQRAISRNINLAKDTLESAEVSQTRQRSDVRHGFRRINGNIQAELSFGTYNDWLLWGLGASAWLTPNPCPNTAQLTIDYTLANRTAVITRTAGTFDFIENGYRPGDWVTTALFINSVNNGQFRITNVAQASITISDGGLTLIDELTPVATPTITYIGSKALIGTTLKTMSIEREILDLDSAGLDLYQIFKGVAINQLGIAARPEGLIQLSFGLVGMTADIDQAATLDSDSTYTAAPSNPPISGIDTAVYIGAFQQNCTEFSVNLDNQRTTAAVLGSPSTPDIFEGVAKVTGTFSQFITSVAQLSNFQNESDATLAARYSEVGTSNFLGLSLFKVRYLDASIDPPQNGPVILPFQFESLERTFTGGTNTFKEVFQIQRSS